MKLETKNTPYLRFPEFSGGWAEDNLGNLAEVTTGNKDTQDSVVNGKYPFFVRSQIVERIDTFSYAGEAILTSGDGVGVGKNFHYINGKFDFHQRVYCLRNFAEGLSGKFLFYYFSEKFNRRVMRMSAKNSVDSVRRDMVVKMPILFPSPSEQQKIAVFLSAVDEKIRQLTRKKDLLLTYKKGVMQQVFSQKIRFKKDEGDDFPEWEEKKLGDIATFSKGSGISKEDTASNGMYECIRYGELYTHYGETIDKVVSRTNLDISELTVSNENDVIIPSSGETNIDIARAASVLRKGIALGGDVTIIRSNLNGVFLSYYLNSKKKHDIARLAQGVSVVHLYPNHLATLTIEIPSAEEQRLIADFISSVGEKIALAIRQIERMKAFKAGLLQQMFV